MATVATIADTTIVGDNEDQLVTMIVDDQLFGIPILQVQDIVEASKITPVPLAPSAIAGVLNLRGRIVTVVDLRKLLDNYDEVPWESQMGVTVEHKGDLYTLLVDAIGDVRTLPKHDFDKAPSTMEDNVRRLCSGIYRLRGNLLVVLDVARILHAEIIEATPMLTVEERRSRKSMAVEQSDGGGGKAHQLSALMTDLNAYESETEGVFGAAADTTHEDMKSRKRANRHRRPVAERWREVLEEKARKSGHTAYRMREPDEETVEIAREEMANEDSEWASRVRDPESLPAHQTDEAPDMPAHETEADLPAQDWPDFNTDMPAVAEDMQGDNADSSADATTTLDPEAMADDSEPAAEEPQDIGAAGESAAWDLASSSLAEDSLPADTGDVDPAVQAEFPGEPTESRTADAAQADDAMDETHAEIMEPVPETEAAELQASEAESSGIAASWWDKLRAKSSGVTSEPTPSNGEKDETDSPSDTAETAATETELAAGLPPADEKLDETDSPSDTAETAAPETELAADLPPADEKTDETSPPSDEAETGVSEPEPEVDLAPAADEPARTTKPTRKAKKGAAKKATKTTTKKKSATKAKRSAKAGTKPKARAKSGKKT